MLVVLNDVYPKDDSLKLFMTNSKICADCGPPDMEAKTDITDA
jgi:hypothetical protein